MPIFTTQPKCTTITYLPRELTSGNGTKQDAAIQQGMAIKAMVSAVEISN